jgi:hypothetical protein
MDEITGRVSYEDVLGNSRISHLGLIRAKAALSALHIPAWLQAHSQETSAWIQVVLARIRLVLCHSSFVCSFPHQVSRSREGQCQKRAVERNPA